MWHAPWIIQSTALVQPFQHWESSETKRRFHNLLLVSGLYDDLVHLKVVLPASTEQIGLVHTERYINEVRDKSGRVEGGFAGEEVTFTQFGYDIAALAVGGVLKAVNSVMSGEVHAAYALVRPPGHHALPDCGMGFCIFNNIAIATKYLLHVHPREVKKIAIVDYDVHHGNGTQDVFEECDNVLFISIHQDGNYPADSGKANDMGKSQGIGTTVNISLPPGSGKGAYEYAFEKVVLPKIQGFDPDFILVSSGFDASYADPLSAMILSSSDFRFMASSLVAAAERMCQGKIVFVHEGGYSEIYVPFCGVAVIEALLQSDDKIEDPFLTEVNGWGGQGLQPHQRDAIDKVAVLHGL